MRKGSFLLLVLAGCGRDVDRPQRVIEQRLPGAVARGDGLLRDAMIVAHARVRTAFGAPPLAWDDQLAVDAAGYAAVLAESDTFRHSSGRRGGEAEGENLWTGTRNAYHYDEMAGHWAAERTVFRPGVMPDVSTTGRWQDVAHYTQMVWPGTTRFGCALASNPASDYLVCRYAPPGNVVGRPIG